LPPPGHLFTRTLSSRKPTAQTYSCLQLGVEVWSSRVSAKELGLVTKGSPYSLNERRVPEPIPVLGSQPAGDVSHKPGGRLPLLSARPAVTLAAPKKAVTSFGWRRGVVVSGVRQ